MSKDTSPDEVDEIDNTKRIQNIEIDKSSVPTPNFNPESAGLPTVKSPEPVKLNVGPDYSTSFCRPRPTESTSTILINTTVSGIKNSFQIDGLSWINALILFLSIGGLLFLLVLWYSFKYPDAIGPFLTGIFRLSWCLFIYFIIISVLVLFIQFMYYFAYWIGITIQYFNLFMNPLLNERVSELSCYFSDYVNFLIYYPAMVFYFICLILLVLFDILVMAPVMVFFGFIVGILFSLLGEQPDTVKKVIGTVSGIVQEKYQKLKTSAKDSMAGLMRKPVG